MKKIILLIILHLTIYGFSQNEDYLSALKNELKYLQNQNIPIRKVALNSEGWVILYGDFGFSYFNIPQDIEKKLNKANQNQVKILDVNICDNNFSYVFLADGSMYLGYLYPPENRELINFVNNELKGDKLRRMKFFSYYEKTWIFGFGKNGFAGYKLPSRLRNILIDLNRRNKTIKQVLFFQDGWLVLFGKNSIAGKNIPRELKKQLLTLRRQNQSIKSVTIYKDKYIIIFDDNKFRTNF